MIAIAVLNIIWGSSSVVDLLDLPVLDSLPADIAIVVVRVFLAILAFLLIWVLRRLITRLLIAPFRSFAKRSSTDIDNIILDIVEQPSRYIVIALGLFISTSILQLDNVELLFIQRLARTLIIIAIAVGIFNAIGLVGTSTRRLLRVTGINLEDELLPFVRTGLRIVTIAITLIIIIQEWGYNVSGLIAGLGLGGLAFSLAAQDTIANLFGFSTIVGDRPFVVGEYVVTSDAEGVIERVGVRSTQIRTLDQSLIVVPNSRMASATITNWSRLTKRRYNFTIGVTYDADSAAMQRLLDRLREMLAARETVEEGTVVVHFTEFGSSSLDVLIRCNVMLPDWGEWAAERERINLAVMDIVNELGMSFAFPSRSLYVEHLPDPRRPQQERSYEQAIPEEAPAPAPVASGEESTQQDEAGDSPSSGV